MKEKREEAERRLIEGSVGTCGVGGGGWFEGSLGAWGCGWYIRYVLMNSNRKSDF